jgi:hypothetical protein
MSLLSLHLYLRSYAVTIRALGTNTEPLGGILVKVWMKTTFWQPMEAHVLLVDTAGLQHTSVSTYVYPAFAVRNATCYDFLK